MNERIDRLIVTRGLAKSRTLAQRLIKEGAIEICVAGVWSKVKKVSAVYSSFCELRLIPNESQRFVSRAGLKLDYAISFCELELKGKKVLDVGQSTGGFSDCALQHGAISVTGVDVGHGQLDQAIRDNPKVRCLEGLNARELSADIVGDNFDFIVMDISFISQTLVLPKLPCLLNQNGVLVSLVKPQFEVGPEGIGKGGLVKAEGLYLQVEEKICKLLNQLGLEVIKYFDSPIEGGDGNREFFVVAKTSL